ncbi:MAG: hypothetical protein IPH10_02665 [bacterium]|nr:hypothetical protein [bacterium]
MRNVFIILVLCLGSVVNSQAQQRQSQQSPEQAELWRVYQQITDLTATNQDVPAALYNRYFELDRIVNPDQYDSRDEQNPLDQLTDLCPGGTVACPNPAAPYTFSTSGQTNTAQNNCSFPNCRWGRDLFFILEVPTRDSITITTCGSQFDTYLCIFTGACCGQAGSTAFASNDNAPDICGVATTLQAGISRCFEPGTYYVCLDGASVAAFGHYRISVICHGNACIPPITEPECPDDYTQHTEGEFAEGCELYSNTINCGQGFCGQIDQPGDLDLFALTIEDCGRMVYFNVWADDTPGRTGFEGGLDSYLRMWPVTCEAPLAVDSDHHGAEGAPEGTDSQIQIYLEPGTYFFEVTGEHGTSGPYEVFVGCSSCEQ